MIDLIISLLVISSVILGIQVNQNQNHIYKLINLIDELHQQIKNLKNENNH